MVSICIYRVYYALPIHQHIVHSPGIDCKACYLIFCCRKLNALCHFLQEGIHVPHQVALFLLDAVRKSVDLLCAYFLSVPVSDYVPAAGGANIYGQMYPLFFHEYI